jgi:hypothetical protein
MTIARRFFLNQNGLMEWVCLSRRMEGVSHIYCSVCRTIYIQRKLRKPPGKRKLAAERNVQRGETLNRFHYDMGMGYSDESNENSCQLKYSCPYDAHAVLFMSPSFSVLLCSTNIYLGFGSSWNWESASKFELWIASKFLSGFKSWYCLPSAKALSLCWKYIGT